MTRYVWVGRSHTGGEERGVVEAATRDAALTQVRSRGVLVTRLEEGSDYEAEPIGSPSVPELSPPPAVRREGESVRDKVFYVGVALAFTSLGLGLLTFAPVLTYDCERDALGAVNCVVHRRVCGLVPLADRRLSRILATETAGGSQRSGVGSSRFTESHDNLVLVCSDGTRWKSTNSSDPLGTSNSDLATGIATLLAARSPQEFHAWQGEKVPLLVGTVFLAPAALLIFALLLRAVLPRSLVERKMAEMEQAVSVAKKRRAGQVSRREGVSPVIPST